MTVKNVLDLWNEPPEKVNCIVNPGFLPTSGVGALTGEPGVGKSFAILQGGFEIASGRRLFGLFPTTKCIVCYLETERQNPIARSRVKNLRNRREYADIEDRFFYWDDEQLNLDTVQGKNKLEEIVVACGAKLIIIDSLSTTLDDQNHRAATSKPLRHLKELSIKHGVAFFIIHHVKKRGIFFSQKSGTFVQPPLMLDDLTGAKKMLHGIDFAMGILKKGPGTREIVILKSNFAPEYISDMSPMEYKFTGSMPIPYIPSGKHAQFANILDYLDLAGDTGMTDLEGFTKISRPTLISHVKELTMMGLVEVSQGGGRGVQTLIKPIYNARI